MINVLYSERVPSNGLGGFSLGAWSRWVGVVVGTDAAAEDANRCRIAFASPF